ncbi:hypothetical protein ACFX12_045758 [Malus domestica]
MCNGHDNVAIAEVVMCWCQRLCNENVVVVMIWPWEGSSDDGDGWLRLDGGSCDGEGHKSSQTIKDTRTH